MTGQQKLTELIRVDPRGEETRRQYRTISNLYNEEFGIGFVMGAISEAREALLNFKFKDRRKNLSKMKPQYLVGLAFEELIGQMEQEPRGMKRMFIGTKEVSFDNYIIYCKGLYWLAAFDIMNN